MIERDENIILLTEYLAEEAFPLSRLAGMSDLCVCVYVCCEGDEVYFLCALTKNTWTIGLSSSVELFAPAAQLVSITRTNA